MTKNDCEICVSYHYLKTQVYSFISIFPPNQQDDLAGLIDEIDTYFIDLNVFDSSNPSKMEFITHDIMYTYFKILQNYIFSKRFLLNNTIPQKFVKGENNIPAPFQTLNAGIPNRLRQIDFYSSFFMTPVGLFSPSLNNIEYYHKLLKDLYIEYAINDLINEQYDEDTIKKQILQDFNDTLQLFQEEINKLQIPFILTNKLKASMETFNKFKTANPNINIDPNNYEKLIQQLNLLIQVFINIQQIVSFYFKELDKIINKKELNFDSSTKTSLKETLNKIEKANSLCDIEFKLWKVKLISALIKINSFIEQKKRNLNNPDDVEKFYQLELVFNELIWETKKEDAFDKLQLKTGSEIQSQEVIKNKSNDYYTIFHSEFEKKMKCKYYVFHQQKSLALLLNCPLNQLIPSQKMMELPGDKLQFKQEIQNDTESQHIITGHLYGANYAFDFIKDYNGNTDNLEIYLWNPSPIYGRYQRNGEKCSTEVKNKIHIFNDVFARFKNLNASWLSEISNQFTEMVSKLPHQALNSSTGALETNIHHVKTPGNMPHSSMAVDAMSHHKRDMKSKVESQNRMLNKSQMGRDALHKIENARYVPLEKYCNIEYTSIQDYLVKEMNLIKMDAWFKFDKGTHKYQLKTNTTVPKFFLEDNYNLQNFQMLDNQDYSNDVKSWKLWWFGVVNANPVWIDSNQQNNLTMLDLETAVLKRELDFLKIDDLLNIDSEV